MDDETECFEWRGYTDRHGYGKIRDPRLGFSTSVSRLSASIFLGFDPTSAPMILHSCDNRRCWNPDHLRPGTAQENTRDMMDRGRSRIHGKGSAHSQATLTEDQVLAMRSMYASGARQVDIAAAFGVSNRRVWDIVHRKSWTHI